VPGLIRLSGVPNILATTPMLTREVERRSLLPARTRPGTHRRRTTPGSDFPAAVRASRDAGQIVVSEVVSRTHPAQAL